MPDALLHSSQLHDPLVAMKCWRLLLYSPLALGTSVSQFACRFIDSVAKHGLTDDLFLTVGSSGYSIFVSVALERKGVYAIRAKIPVASENTVAEAFTRLMSDAEEFLQSSLRWFYSNGWAFSHETYWQSSPIGSDQVNFSKLVQAG